MPRAKRTLQEADPNAGAAAPAMKKATTGTALGKENQNYQSKTVAELSSMLRERGLPYSGRKAQLIERVEQHYWPEDTKTQDGAISNSKETTPVGTSLEFIMLCRPGQDVIAEKQAANEKYDPYDHPPRENFTCGTDKCICGKPIESNPDWKWVITKQGNELSSHLYDEAMKRDQDEQGQYHYNDFSGYGFQEVVENHLVAFNTVFTKKPQDHLAMWHHVEAFAHFLPGDGPWFMSDDSQGLLRTLAMVGHAVLSTLQLLQSRGLLKPDSPIKDIPFVLGLFIQMVKLWPGDYEEPELMWVKAMLARAKKNGIVLAGLPFGIEKSVKDYEDIEYDNREEGAINWSRSYWGKEFLWYRFMHGPLGGDEYDLTKKK